MLNDRLPAAIRVLAVDEVPEGFHARHSARAKRYHYRIWRGDIVPPFLARYVTHHPYPLDESHAAGCRAGRRRARLHLLCRRRSRPRPAPCRSLRRSPHTTNVRTIHESRFERHAEELVYIVRGSGFLHHMVRNLVGTFLLVGKGSIAPCGRSLAILEARDRRAAGPTAPAEGLYLVEVEY